jgi:hypothetical protein
LPADGYVATLCPAHTSACGIHAKGPGSHPKAALRMAAHRKPSSPLLTVSTLMVQG